MGPVIRYLRVTTFVNDCSRDITDSVDAEKVLGHSTVIVTGAKKRFQIFYTTLNWLLCTDLCSYRQSMWPSLFRKIVQNQISEFPAHDLIIPWALNI
jgi:hypothetical protein